jgi:GH35 family endo-1,4-beta-xylanase
VYVWDVINEAVTNHEITDRLGEKILVDAFKWAHETNPQVALSYNDFAIIDDEGGSNDDRTRCSQRLIAQMQTDGAPISILGVQSHMHLPLPRGDEIWRTLDQWAQFKVPIEITEFDLSVKDDALQSEYLREFMTAVFSHEAVRSFVMWGFWEGSLAEHATANGLFAKNWRARPAAQTYMQLVNHDWCTNERLKTDAQGKVQLRAFMGTLAVVAKCNGLKAQTDVELTADKECKLILR